ncbi:MAG: translation initiation factor eIF-1A [Methanomassiliicoccales archaeon]|nr:MAG: translation initiation factor eIF-1A [Methanomassiliicoccales archaeon]
MSPPYEEVQSGEEVIKLRYPNKKEGEIFGIADQLLGGSRIRVMCADGVARMGRISGKIRKRMWIREGDLVIVTPWDFQDDKCEITHRYTKTEAAILARKRVLPKAFENMF